MVELELESANCEVIRDRVTSWTSPSQQDVSCRRRQLRHETAMPKLEEECVALLEKEWKASLVALVQRKRWSLRRILNKPNLSMWPFCEVGPKKCIDKDTFHRHQEIRLHAQLLGAMNPEDNKLVVDPSACTRYLNRSYSFWQFQTWSYKVVLLGPPSQTWFRDVQHRRELQIPCCIGSRQPLPPQVLYCSRVIGRFGVKPRFPKPRKVVVIRVEMVFCPWSSIVPRRVASKVEILGSIHHGNSGTVL